MKVARRQIKQFLDTGAGVIEDAEKHVIAFSVLVQTVDLSQQMSKLLLAEIAQHRAKGLLRGNGQNRATGGSQSWFSPRNISKEGLYGRQPHIACADRVAAAGLKIHKKIQHQLGGEILDNELIDGASALHSRKLKQELHSVPIRCGRMGADAPL
jgi:hypothetical protein